MKKTNLLSFILALAMMCSLLSISAGAAKTDEPLGDVLDSGTYTYINGEEILNYIINGKPVVYAEDLKNYGFDVYYDSQTKTLDLKRNYGKTIKAAYSVLHQNLAPGKKVCKYYNANLVVTLNGEKIDCFRDGNTNSYQTVIYFESLKPYGTFFGEDKTNTSKLTLYKTLEEETGAKSERNSSQEINEYKFVSDYKYGKNTYYGILKDGKPDIYGCLFNEKTGFFYMGGFKEGKYHTYMYTENGDLDTYGAAVLRDSKGNRWWVNFLDDKGNDDNTGVYITADDELYTGKVKDGKMIDGEPISKDVFNTGFKGLYSDWSVLERTTDTSGVAYIKLISDKNKKTSGKTYYYQFAKESIPTIKISSNGSVLMGIMGGAFKTNYAVHYDAKTGNWKASTQFFIDSVSNVNSDSGIIGTSVTYYDGKIIDDRYDENGSVISGRQAAKDNPGVNNSPGTSTSPSTITPSTPSQSKSTCSPCSGTGRKTCSSCSGTGKINMYHTGLYGQPGYWADEYCKSCSGIGYHTCIWCQGSGKR